MALDNICFESFAAEKEYRRTHGATSIDPWGTLKEAPGQEGIDRGIYRLVLGLNRIDFIYTKRQSCSGLPEDHKGWSHWRPDSGRSVDYKGGYIDNVKDYGIPKGKQGFIMLRIDTTDPRYARFQQGIGQIPGVHLIEADVKDEDDKRQQQEGVKNMAVQALVPTAVLSERHPAHKTYLTDVWRQVYDLITHFYEPSPAERTHASIIRSLKGRRGV